ncbi:MAG: NADH-quinone oxidoreductase subunit J [Ginsengibacter sp.]
MNASSIIFYCISAFVLGAALLSVTTTKIFRAAIWLLFSLIGIAALYFWLQVQFVAAVQIVVYVGGIVVLIIFSIFLTQQSGTEMPKPKMKTIIFSLLATLSGIGFTYNLIHQYDFAPTSSKPFAVSVSDIGMQMLSTAEYGFVLPFEVVSMLLLAAMVGCIVIAMKVPPIDEIPDTPLKQELKSPELKPVTNVLTTPEKEMEEITE